MVHEIVAPVPEQSRVLLGHASGITEVNVEKCGERIVKGGVVRTARRIMDGWVYVKE
ncbi:MAG: hypothetical protein IJ388_03795 [Oscillospiraceae bacterium]|nr:hypothetical protein [Oscillospiraceae bacterium]